MEGLGKELFIGRLGFSSKPADPCAAYCPASVLFYSALLILFSCGLEALCRLHNRNCMSEEWSTAGKSHRAPNDAL